MKGSRNTDRITDLDELKRRFNELWGSNVSADERVALVRGKMDGGPFTIEQCREALLIQHSAASMEGWCRVQTSVTKAIQSRLRRLYREQQQGASK